MQSCAHALCARYENSPATMNSTAIEYDVFISCKSEDYAYARDIYNYLTNECGRKVFLADAELRKKGVAVFGEVIDEALDSADHLILFASKAEYAQTTYVKNEWRLFLEEKRSGRKEGNILTVLKGVKLASLPISLRQFQSFDFEDFRGVVDFLPRLKAQEQSVNVAEHGSKPTSKSEPTPVVKQVAQPAVRSYKVGDYYNENGKEGVVFSVDATGRHGKIVSLDDAKLPWCTKVQYDRKIFIGAGSSTEAKLNTDIVMARADRKEYPVFMWCRGKGADWYLPSKEELVELSEVRTIVSETMRSKGGKNLSDWYWASSEYDECFAWYVGMGNGRTYFYYKDYLYYVRAVSAF